MRVSGEGCDNQRTKGFRDKRSTEGQCAEWHDIEWHGRQLEVKLFKITEIDRVE